MKKTVLWTIFIVSMLVTGTAFASIPNTNYEPGKGAISIDFAYTSLEAVTGGYEGGNDDNTSKKWNFGVNAEVVIAPKWSVGFNYASTDGSGMLAGYYSVNTEFTTYELTLQYLAYQNKKVSVIPYAGLAYDKGEVHAPGVGYWGSDTKENFLLGTKLVYAFNKQFSSYADIGFGSDIFKYSIGVAYNFTPKVALSVGYDYREVGGFTHQLVPGINVSAEVKRFTVGLTYLF